jgi:hypothetical protein
VVGPQRGCSSLLINFLVAKWGANDSNARWLPGSNNHARYRTILRPSSAEGRVHDPTFALSPAGQGNEMGWRPRE